MDSYRTGGYHAMRIGNQFAGSRYIVQKKLGWGNFSIVWLTYDTKAQEGTTEAPSKVLKEGRAMRERIGGLKEKAVRVVQPEDSSVRNFKSLLELIVRH